MGKLAGQLKTEQYRNFVSAEVETSAQANSNAKFLRIHFKEADLLQHDRSSLKYYFVPFRDCVDQAELLPAYSGDGVLPPAQLINPASSTRPHSPLMNMPDINLCGFHVADIRVVVEERPTCHSVIHHIHYTSPVQSPLTTNDRLWRVFLHSVLHYTSTHRPISAALKSLFTHTDAPQVSVALHRLVLKGLGVPSNPCASSPHIKYTFTPQLISNIIAADRLESVCQSTSNHAASAVASPASSTEHVTTTQ